jgi:hypothetical protein
MFSMVVLVSKLKPMLKKISLIIALILLAILITPTPFRYGQVFCETPPGKPASACPKEGDIGWNPPLIFQLIVSVQSSRQNVSRAGQSVIK